MVVPKSYVFFLAQENTAGWVKQSLCQWKAKLCNFFSVEVLIELLQKHFGFGWCADLTRDLLQLSGVLISCISCLVCNAESRANLSFGLCQVVLWSFRVNSRYSLFVFRDLFREYVWVSHAHSYELSKKCGQTFLAYCQRRMGNTPNIPMALPGYASKWLKIASLTSLLFHTTIFKDGTILDYEVHF